MRKSVTYLTSLRHGLTKSIEDLHDLAEHLESTSFDISNLTPEDIRSTEADFFDDMVKIIKVDRLAFGKELKLVEENARKLRDFF